MAVYTRLVRQFDANPHGTDWVVGDVHGCFGALDALLDDVAFDPKQDRLFSVGDLIDRGPESERAMEYLAQPWFHAVRGNHEQFLLATDLADRQQCELWALNGGGWFLDLPASRQTALRQAVSRLPLLIDIGGQPTLTGIVHADVPAGCDWQSFRERLIQGSREAIHTALFSRARALGEVDGPVAGVERIYCGHTPFPARVYRSDNVVFLDTGAVFGLFGELPGGCLTLMRVDGGRSQARWP